MLRVKILATVVLVLVSLISQNSLAATLEVPNQYPTIATALAAANSGDKVQLAPGHYFEHGLELPPAITLTGSGETPAETIIDGQGLGRILAANHLEVTSFVKNITFQNGWAQTNEGYENCGGAIYVNGANVVISNCQFLNNQADADGGAISIMRADPLIVNCKFENNRAGEGGGALDCSYVASPNIQFSTFTMNTASYGGALACRGDSTPNFYSCQFDQNTTEGDFAHGGAVLTFFWGEPTFSKCTFSRNRADVGGAIYAANESPADLNSCTVTANVGHSYAPAIFTEDNDTEIHSSIIAFHEGHGLLSLGPEVPYISCSDIYGNSGGNWFGEISRQADARGNMEVDPLFCAGNLELEYQFRLEDDSPCSIDGGACDDMGAWAIGCEVPMENLVKLPRFEVIWVDGVPIIIWEVGDYRSPISFRLARASDHDPTHEDEIPYSVGPEGEFIASDSGFIQEPGIEYFYRLYMVVGNGEDVLLATIPLGNPPKILAIEDLGAWPNPFNPQTKVHFKLSSNQRVKVEVYGIDGRRLRTLADKVFQSGPQNLTWNGQDNGGRVMASGSYIVVVRGEQDTHKLKVTLLK